MTTYRLRIEPDADADGPRDWDNLGTMVCWHRNYNLGDAHTFAQGNGYYDRTDGYDACFDDDPQGFQRFWKKYGRGGVLLPLYLYDHSGITMSTGSFGDPWDSGQVGYVYATRDDLARNFMTTRVAKGMRERALKVLESEVATYAQYLEGDVWGFTLERGEPCDHGDLHYEEEDSCWSFYGFSAYDPITALRENGMGEHLGERVLDALSAGYEEEDLHSGGYSFTFEMADEPVAVPA